jgi:hypothetical protein
MDYRVKGDFMKPFPSFYDPRGLEPQMASTARYEAMILKEVELTIKQVRSSKNLSTKIRKNA